MRPTFSLFTLALWITIGAADAQVLNPANGHVYVLSTPGTFLNARARAQAAGGYLVAINDAAEEAFVRAHFDGGVGTRFWIGLTDETVEGTFVLDSGEPLTYTRWCPGEPNNFNNEDYVEWVHGNVCTEGWNDRTASFSQPGLIEIPPIIYAGNGHGYLLTPEPSDFGTARAFAQAAGGYLVAVNNISEQAFLDATFQPSCVAEHWIGLTDEITEGVFRWDSGEPLTYTYWRPGEPNNQAGEDYVALTSTAPILVLCERGWNDRVASGVLIRGIVEIPAQFAISAPSGPGSLALDNLYGRPGSQYLTAITLVPGTFPNGWFFGVDISLFDFLLEISLGAPFTGSLNASGRSSFVVPAGIPPGLTLQGVTALFVPITGHFVEATDPISFAAP